MFQAQTFGSIRAKLPLVGKGQRVGLMGGSFNPPHEGHRRVADTATKRLQLDFVWWLVTPGNPLKDRAHVPPLAQRMAWVEDVCHDAKSRVCGLEQHLPTAFTAATLAYLTQRRPDVRFVWVMGADSLSTFHRWRAWMDIAERVPIAVVDRPYCRLPSLAQKAAIKLRARRLPEFAAPLLPDLEPPVWTFLTTRLSALSSTDLRERSTKSQNQ